jgi:hypothetical protein
MQVHQAGDLEIRVSKIDDEKTAIDWLGVSNARDPAAIINPLIEKIVAELDCREVILNFGKLEYINSSTVPPIIRLIKEINKLQVKIVLTYDHSVKWQQESFRAFNTLAKVLGNIVIPE